MRDTLAHRGPDDAGVWLEGPVGLGHRRLAIVDLAGGSQPMANENADVWITYNGEIYNHRSLRSGLEARGHRYRTRSDTETVLHLYEEQGERCVEALEGMFAFALWDRRERRLLLARDRLGIKPLYYALTEHELLFGSEIKAILAAGMPASFNRSVLPEFLATRFVSGEETFFNGVRKLLPGRTLSWSPGQGALTRRYWRPPPAISTAPSTRKTQAQEVRRRLEGVVASHLMSDVPVGLLLSGGLDSSALACLMAGASRDPIHTFAVGLDEPDANELAYARLVARSLGARHRDVTVTRERFFDALPALVWHEDEPIAFPSSVLLYFVSKLAGNDVKVVLTGEGADELFLGYPWYRATAWNERLGRPYRALTSAALRKAVRRAIGGLPWSLRRYLSRSFLALDSSPRSLCCENFAAFPDALRRTVLRDGAPPPDHDPYVHWLTAHAEGQGKLVERMGRADLQTFVVELLMKQDQMSMAASIESRVPFLDHGFVEHISTLPAHFKLHQLKTKAVLRDAVRDVVPRPILTRRKMGFPVPVGRWFEGPSRALIDELVLSPRALERKLFRPSALARLTEEHRNGVGRHGDRLWLLINLELWHRIFIDGERHDTALGAAG